LKLLRLPGTLVLSPLPAIVLNCVLAALIGTMASWLFKLRS
jgi:hypothetical protein